MSIHRGDTAMLNESVGKCENLSELKEILNRNNEYHYEWKQYINKLVEKNHVNYVQMAKICHSSRNTVKKWCREGVIPQNRQTFLKIAFGFRLNLEETNELLQYYGKYPRLYAKTMEDAICIFLLSHKDDETGDLYLIYQKMHDMVLDKMQKDKAKKVPIESMDTLELEGYIKEQKTLDDFAKFMEQNYASFQTSFQKLIDFIELFINAKEENMHRFFKHNRLDFSYEKMMSQLKNRKEFPDRTKLILLGVHLNMSMEYINNMLALAYMAPMCAKDNLECVVMYVVESAYLNNPSYTIESAMILKHYEGNPAIRQKCEEILEKYWNPDEEYKAVSSEDKDLQFNENISTYLKEVLNDLQWDDEIFRYL